MPAPPLATLLPPPVLEGGRLDEELPEVDGEEPDDLCPLDEPDVDEWPLELLGALTGGFGSALPTAAPECEEPLAWLFSPPVAGTLGGRVGERDIENPRYETGSVDSIPAGSRR
jgi:hypothetical protein